MHFEEAGSTNWRQRGNAVDQLARAFGADFNAQAAHMAAYGGHRHVKRQRNVWRTQAAAQQIEDLLFSARQAVTAGKKDKHAGIANGTRSKNKAICLQRMSGWCLSGVADNIQHIAHGVIFCLKQKQQLTN